MMAFALHIYLKKAIRENIHELEDYVNAIKR